MIAPSTRLGPYEIIARIGAGGMGEVWRARDTRIGRDVAVKILPPEFASSADRLHRFEQEARAAGGLNHPNLVTIHDLGTDNGVPYIVMELLEGETLRERIGTDGTPRIPIRKAIDMSVQIANGLAAAHERGIVHRDLKPENIFVTPDGRVKILDFGLAKLTAVESMNDDSPTQQRDTSPGTVLGTVGYMSPEQVRGQDVDHRTDVFAFGAILYEMLSGNRAFRRDSSVETMNAILNDDPPEMSSSTSHSVPAVSRIVLRCLEKSRGERFQSARDLAFALDAAGGSSSQSVVTASTPVAQPASRWRTVSMGIATLIAVIAIGAAYLIGRASSISPPSPKFTQLTFASGSETQPAISPNGENFAFVRDGDIYLQRTDARNAINLTRSPDVQERAPAFSHDGRHIAFNTESGIFVMGATGESVRRLTNIGFDPTWSPDGKRIAFTRNEGAEDPRARNTNDNPLLVVDVAGGAPRTLVATDAMQPRWSPDGQRIAYWTSDASGRRDVYTVSAAGGEETIVAVTSDAPLDWSPAWSPDSRWLYFSSDRSGTMTLWRVRIDSKTGRLKGEPQMIAAPAPAAGWIAVSGDGRNLVFEAITHSSTVRTARFDAASSQLLASDTPILDGAMLVRSASPSPDGSLVAFTTHGHEELYVMRSDGSDIRQLTNDDARDRGPAWTPDGRITFYSARAGSYQMWSIRPDGSGATQHTNLPNKVFPNFPIVSPDGKRVAASAVDRGAWISDLTDSIITKVDLLPPLPDGGAFWPQSWSPDGLRIAGPRWISIPGIYVYSVSEKTYKKVSDDGLRTAWVDDRRLLLHATDAAGPRHRAGLGGGKTTLLDTVSGERREVRIGPVSPIASTCTGVHCVFVSNQTDSNIWMATLGSEE
ncbi:MAG: serine/threonine-protein kinase [Acidobacteriota bacterium]|nr:serine/threonine-protein kinase [Acidobacteriota bacterium]